MTDTPDPNTSTFTMQENTIQRQKDQLAAKDARIKQLEDWLVEERAERADVSQMRIPFGGVQEVDLETIAREQLQSEGKLCHVIKRTFPTDIMQALQGRIFTQSQADAIIEMVRQRVR